MAGPANPLTEALELPAANSELKAEVSELEQSKSSLDGLFLQEVATLNSAIFALRGLGDAVRQEAAAVAGRPGGWTIDLEPKPLLGRTEGSTIKPGGVSTAVESIDAEIFGSALINIQRVEKDVSHLESQAQKMSAHAAHLTYKATNQLDAGELMTRHLDDIRELSVHQLLGLNTTMAQSQSRLDSVTSAANRTGDTARYHEARFDDHIELCKLEELESQYRQEIRTMETQKRDLETKIRDLQQALDSLSRAVAFCSEVQRESERLKAQSMILCEQFSTMSSAIRPILGAVGPVAVEIDEPDLLSDILRYVQPLLNLLGDLDHAGFLEFQNYPLLQQLRAYDQSGEGAFGTERIFLTSI
ncbi:hypothetical protein AbraIFM66950_006621 [Aspergillus brasiliensis]|nr:hypothetical protein AbraIFM66950_006621 [Aspergillus brasiliensis]